jgi:predicted secreted protein
LAKYAAKGAKLEVNTEGTTWVEIVNFSTISSGGGEVEKIDATTHDSAAGAREYVAGFKGEFTADFEIMYDPGHASHQLLATYFGSGAVKDWKLTLPTTPSAVITFSGYVSKLPLPNLPVDGMMTIPVGLQLASAPTFPTGS